MATGTPYFIARDIPCEMCEDIPCAAACPTDALSKELTDIRDADMGVAVLTGPDTCYSVTGVAHCRACYIACPIKDEAITMEQKRAGTRIYFEPTVHARQLYRVREVRSRTASRGEASIKVLPRHLAKHDTGTVDMHHCSAIPAHAGHPVKQRVALWAIQYSEPDARIHARHDD